MQLITEPRNLSLTEINYRIGGLRESHHEILSHLIQGKSKHETALLLSMSFPTLQGRILSACDHAGVKTVHSLIAMFTIWSYEKTITKLGFEKEIDTVKPYTEYQAGNLQSVERTVTE